jgi:diguanylate cyclase (GGDEF)-like protein
MLEQQSREDQLTGLYNRRGLEEMLARLARRSGCAEHPLVGIVIDVDDFKAVNDKFGHSVGDRVLVEIAQAISDSVRPNDICGRVGGDEFMVLLPSCAMSEAHGIAERIRDAVNALKLETDSRVINPSVSVGLVALPSGVTAVTDALAALGPALKRAKADGKNAVAV